MSTPTPPPRPGSGSPSSSSSSNTWQPLPSAASQAPPSFAPTDGSTLEADPSGDPPRRTTSKTFIVALSLFSVLCLGLGVFLLWPSEAAPLEEAPMPRGEVEVVNPQLAGPVGDEPVDVEQDEKADEDPAIPEEMSVSQMAPSSVFMPAAQAYSPIEGNADFERSRYNDGFQTLSIPADPRYTAWYSDGAPLVGGEEGTTFLASHISASGQRGAFWNLHKMQGGEMIYTKDAAGAIQAWQVTQVRVLDHHSFPQEYWAADGERQLVIATCGGSVNAQGYYKDNVFVIADPVEMPQEL